MPTIGTSSVILASVVGQDASIHDIFSLERHVVAPRRTVRDIGGVVTLLLLNHSQVAARGVGWVAGINALEFGAGCQGEADRLTLQYSMSDCKAIGKVVVRGTTELSDPSFRETSRTGNGSMDDNAGHSKER
jgi:hypothetical protein